MAGPRDRCRPVPGRPAGHAPGPRPRLGTNYDRRIAEARLDDITLNWLTNTGASSSRSYWDAGQEGGGPFDAVDVSTVPVAVTAFPGEVYRAPRSWGEQNFHKLIYWNEVDKGGHFAGWEQPDIFVDDVRAAFRSLR